MNDLNLKEMMLFALWFFVVVIAMTLICKLLTMASTIGNLIGILLIPIVIYVSLATNFFTNIKFKKNEKSD